MAGIWFYHLERASLDAVLPALLQKTLDKGWRAVVRAGSRERLTALDGHLWTYTDDSFLPHGLDDQPGAQDQPVLLTMDTARPNAAQVLFIVDGAACPEARDEGLGGLERVIVLFDGRDPEALSEARALWKEAKDTGLDLSYWQQDAQGGWEKKA